MVHDDDLHHISARSQVTSLPKSGNYSHTVRKTTLVCPASSLCDEVSRGCAPCGPVAHGADSRVLHRNRNPTISFRLNRVTCARWRNGAKLARDFRRLFAAAGSR